MKDLHAQWKLVKYIDRDIKDKRGQVVGPGRPFKASVGQGLIDELLEFSTNRVRAARQ